MAPQEDQSNPRTLSDVGYHFLLGAAFGLFCALIPLEFTKYSLILWNVSATVALVLFCGTLSALFGKKFLNSLRQFLESFPQI